MVDAIDGTAIPDLHFIGLFDAHDNRILLCHLGHIWEEFLLKKAVPLFLIKGVESFNMGFDAEDIDVIPFYRLRFLFDFGEDIRDRRDDEGIDFVLRETAWGVADESAFSKGEGGRSSIW